MTFKSYIRFIIDDFVIKYCQNVKKKDFIVKIEEIPNNKVIKRVYLSDLKTDELVDEMNELFKRSFDIPRFRNGQRQEFNTLISEEAQLFAKYLRDEKKTWSPRIPNIV